MSNCMISHPALLLLPDRIHELSVRQRLRDHLIGPMVSEILQVLWQRVPRDTHHQPTVAD